MEERKPNIAEYLIVIVMIIIATLAKLFGRSPTLDKESNGKKSDLK